MIPLGGLRASALCPGVSPGGGAQVMESKTDSKPARRSVRAAYAAAASFLVALVAGPAAAFAQSTAPPDPTTIGTNLANTAGNTILNTAVAVIPVLVVVLAGFWAIRLVMKKLGLGRAKV